jgi:hypothetical protein
MTYIFIPASHPITRLLRVGLLLLWLTVGSSFVGVACEFVGEMLGS